MLILSRIIVCDKDVYLLRFVTKGIEYVSVDIYSAASWKVTV